MVEMMVSSVPRAGNRVPPRPGPQTAALLRKSSVEGARSKVRHEISFSTFTEFSFAMFSSMNHHVLEFPMFPDADHNFLLQKTENDAGESKILA